MLFGMLKLERVNHRQYRTRDEARADLFDYLERFHNPRMRHGTPRQDRKLSALTQPSVAMGQNPTAAFARELLQEVNADEDGVPLVPRNLVDAVDLGRCSSMPTPSNRRRLASRGKCGGGTKLALRGGRWACSIPRPQSASKSRS